MLNLKRILLPLFLFILFFSYYLVRLKTLPISYYDEAWWVGRSFLFELFIKGDYKNPLWQTFIGFDQPKLTEYVFGAALYPHYLQVKNQRSDYNFNKYLIDHNFYESGNITYREYKSNTQNFINWGPDDSGTSEQLLKKYGKNFSKTIELITTARIMNAFLLTLSVLIVFNISKLLSNNFVSLLLALFFGFNELLITTSLVAHADALFLLLLHTGLLLFLLIFQTPKKMKHSTRINLIMFTIIAGLCIGTKLNGSLLLILFNALMIITMVASYIRKSMNQFRNRIGTLLFVNGGSLGIVFLLDPYLYFNPIAKWWNMFSYRDMTATWQMTAFGPALYTYPERIGRIVSNFFWVKSSTFNLFSFIGINNWILNFAYIILFSLGVISTIKSVWLDKKLDPHTLVGGMFIITSGVMVSYLKLDWDRYYLPLLYFILYFEIRGLTEIGRIVFISRRA